MDAAEPPRDTDPAPDGGPDRGPDAAGVRADGGRAVPDPAAPARAAGPGRRAPRALRSWWAGPRRLVASDVACLATIAAALVVYWRAVRDVWLIGPDLFHIMVAARLTEENSLAEVLTSRIQPHLAFYRPLTSLQFSLDQLAWGLDPTGYQVENLIAFGFCLTAFWWLARRFLTTRTAGLGALVAVGLFAFHPIAWSVVPWIERRSECTMAGFAMLALAAQTSPKIHERRFPPLLPALFSLLAMSCKDSALALVPLYGVAALVHAQGPTFAARLGRALVAWSPQFVVAAVFFALRLRAIGGLGGDENTSLANFARFPVIVSDMLGMLLVPEVPSAPGLLFAWLLVATVLASLLALVPWTRAFGLAPAATADTAAVGLRAFVVFGLWLLIFAAAYCLRGFITPWYVFGPSVAWCLLVGVLAEALVGRVARGPWPHRLAALVAAATLVGTVVEQASRTPALTGDPHVEGLSEQERSFYAGLAERIVESPAGAVIEAPTAELRYRSDIIKWVELADLGRPVGVFRDRAALAEADGDAYEVAVLYRNLNER